MMRTVLFTHYNPNVNFTENNTYIKQQQQKAFINLLGDSPIIKRLYRFFHCNGKFSVKFTGVVAHWQKLRDCFLKVIVPGRLYLCMSVCVVRHVIRHWDLG